MGLQWPLSSSYFTMTHKDPKNYDWSAWAACVLSINFQMPVKVKERLSQIHCFVGNLSAKFWHVEQMCGIPQCWENAMLCQQKSLFKHNIAWSCTINVFSIALVLSTAETWHSTTNQNQHHKYPQQETH